MATIAITETFLSSVVSVFNQQTIRFTITTGVAPTVTIEGYTFAPVKIFTNVGGLDTYDFDCTDILKYLIGYPPFNTTDVLHKDITIAISGSGATTQNISARLIFAYEQDGNNIIGRVISHGRLNDNIYINSNKIGFYYSGTAGTKEISIGADGLTDSIALVNGYNFINLTNESRYVSGDLYIDGALTFLNVIYRPQKTTETEAIYWLNDSGCWDVWYFRKLTTHHKTNSGSEIPIYNRNYNTTIAESLETNKSKEIIVNLDTIAINAEHYEQLIKIKDSFVVLYNGVLYKVESVSESIAECKQNLLFNLSLKVKQNVPTF